MRSGGARISCGELGFIRAESVAAARSIGIGMRRFLRTVTAVLLLAAAAAGPVAASDDAAAKSLAIGVDAYRQGSLEASIEALSEALQGPLSSRQAAKALYYRGLAYRALGKPGQAVADLRRRHRAKEWAVARPARGCRGQSRGRAEGGWDHR